MNEDWPGWKDWRGVVVMSVALFVFIVGTDLLCRLTP